MVRFLFAKNVTLELHAHISLKELIFVDRINGDIANATGAVITIGAPAIGVREVQADGVRQHVPGFHGYPLNVHTGVEDI